tara:strand:+ start:1092 stop:1343 length:252 start_codon:yes stop_codon:yes gene_type:complete
MSDVVPQQILVEYLTENGSGFAITEEGDQVYLSDRLVEKMNVQPGDVLDAFIMLNYADKRDAIKWRAMRVMKPTKIVDMFQDA